MCSIPSIFFVLGQDVDIFFYIKNTRKSPSFVEKKKNLTHPKIKKKKVKKKEKSQDSKKLNGLCEMDEYNLQLMHLIL